MPVANILSSSPVPKYAVVNMPVDRRQVVAVREFLDEIFPELNLSGRCRRARRQKAL